MKLLEPILSNHSNGNLRIIRKLIACTLLLNIASYSSFAQYDIKKHTINNGSGTSSGGSYTVKSSIAQVDASNLLTGGNYQLNGGFWQENNDLIFMNGFD